ncbi:MAG: glycosyltransferase family 4 protein [bacterium]|nr:glycosyltransferase family 4 protein [bacterium]
MLPASRPVLLLIAPYFMPAHYGGAPQLYDLLLRRLTAFEPVVLAEGRGCDAEAVARFDAAAPVERGYQVRRVERLSLHFDARTVWGKLAETVAFYRSTARAFDGLVARLRPAVVVCGGTYRGGWLLNRVPRGIARVNYVLGEELTMRLEYGPAARWMRRQQLRAYRRADLNLVISRYSGERLRALAGLAPEKIRCLPCFIDTTRFHPPADRTALRRRLGWEGRTVALTVARLVARKGVDQVLRALAAARGLPEDWLYIIGGRGEEEARLKTLAAELGLEAQVRFLGFVPDAELPNLFGAADLFVQTNRDVAGDTEGFGIVFLEAGACGTAVLGGRAGGTGDAIEEGATGLRVDGDDTSAIAAALVRLLSDPSLRRAMGEAGRARVECEFNAETGARQFEAALEPLCRVPDASVGHGASRRA